MDTKIRDISAKTTAPLLDISATDIMPLPGVEHIAISQLAEEKKEAYECSLDGVSAICIPRPKNKYEEDRLVRSFLTGLRKLLSKDSNWTFWQQLVQSLDNCVRCQTCSEACPIYLASGRQEIYKPLFRSDILRQIIKKYLNYDGWFVTKLTGNDVTLNWTTIARLAELSYRCNLCRRCAQVCPMGVDNGLIAREIRKLFSQEMGLAPKELHELGTVPQLSGKTGGEYSFNNVINYIENDIKKKTGKTINVPVDKKGADFLFIQTSMDSPWWLKCPECFAIVFDAGGLDWTLSSELGFGGTNFGIWYDDIQFARVASRHMDIARKLKVKRIVLGECGHAYKGLAGIADRMLSGDMNMPRQNWMPLVADILLKGKIKLDLRKNDFPATLHDPCNIVRHMGIVEPQRKIMKLISPKFREMEPNGVNNYCCGGGSGFVLISGLNFPEWKDTIAGRMKVHQILEVFHDVLDPSIRKYVAAPCFTCKLHMRQLFERYKLHQNCNIMSGGLIELIVNSMVDTEQPFIEFNR